MYERNPTTTWRCWPEAGGSTSRSTYGLHRRCPHRHLRVRAAPIQVNYLGYPGTMGADFIDYLIADAMVIPAPSRQHYAEKHRLPAGQLSGERRERAIADSTPSRAESWACRRRASCSAASTTTTRSRPASSTSGCGSSREVDGSVLWLLRRQPARRRATCAGSARSAGVDAGSAGLRAARAAAEHLARHRLADLFLDTLPYNAHTTASDALWAGLPVLTCLGETFAGRVAASLLHAVGLPELVTRRRKSTRPLAIDLATTRQSSRGSGGSWRTSADGAALRYRAVCPPSRGGLHGDVRTASGRFGAGAHLRASVRPRIRGRLADALSSDKANAGRGKRARGCP